MNDPNMKNFEGRIGRINRIHRGGGGFEAEGALGMSYYNSQRPRRRRHRVVSLLIVLTIVMMTLKTGMQLVLGDSAYEERVKNMAAGSLSDRLGAFVLQADPVSLALARQFRQIIH